MHKFTYNNNGRLHELFNGGILESDVIDAIKNNDFIIMESTVESLMHSHIELASYMANSIINNTETNNLSTIKSNIEMSTPSHEYRVRKGKTVMIPINIVNNTELILNSATTPYVNLSYHIKDTNNDTITFDGIRTPVGVLYPSESSDMNMHVQAPDKKGIYTLELTLVQEMVTWLEDVNGSFPIKVKLEVQ